MSQEKAKDQKDSSSSEHKYTHSDQPGSSKIESEPILSNPKVSLDDKSKAQRAQSDTKLAEQAPKASGSGPTDHGPSVTESARRVVVWAMTGFFDWNPNYFIQVRGILNVIHLILSLTCVIMLSQACKINNYSDAFSTDHFICDPPATFLFVSSCGAFLTATLYIFCCMLSKTTANLLFHSSFEVSYFVLYLILLLTGSITLLVTAISYESDQTQHVSLIGTNQKASIVGLVTSIMYGVSAVWFFISHRFDIHNGSQAQVP